ncbi:hypothetical protein [Lysobacter gummosus]|uniref:hypothetical protein n=1 Tax=Lysobacter gummosus TaxID=262324 RepID=UPI00362B66BC
MAIPSIAPSPAPVVTRRSQHFDRNTPICSAELGTELTGWLRLRRNEMLRARSKDDACHAPVGALSDDDRCSISRPWLLRRHSLRRCSGYCVSTADACTGVTVRTDA